MIIKDMNLISAVFQIVATSFKGYNCDQHFMNVRFVPSFYMNHFFRKKRYGILLTRVWS